MNLSRKQFQNCVKEDAFLKIMTKTGQWIASVPPQMMFGNVVGSSPNGSCWCGDCEYYMIQDAEEDVFDLLDGRSVRGLIAKKSNPEEGAW